VRVLFVHNAAITFVTNDLRLLAERYDVTEHHVRGHRLRPLQAWRLVRRTDLVFGWFASLHTLLPVLCARIQGKRSVVVLGGYDVAAEPEIGYGLQRGGPRRWVTRLLFRAATLLLPVSQHNYSDAIHKAGISPDKLRLVFNGVDLPAPKAGGVSRQTVLTVGRVDRSNLQRKGLQQFVDAARLLPGLPFVVVGGGDPAVLEALKASSPPNVTFTGQLAGEELAAEFQRAAVYVQASRYESFGLAVAEAMASGCLPVLSRAGALPEVGGDVAVYIDGPGPEALAEAVEAGMAVVSSDPERVSAGRRRIEQCFSLDRRAAQLYGLIDRLTRRTSRPDSHTPFRAAE
jgi:glycosyltransferase involved in cell wall biosynthesis